MSETIRTEDVYTPEEMLSIHLTHGWANYIWSSHHARRMQAAQFKSDDAAFAAHVKGLEGKK